MIAQLSCTESKGPHGTVRQHESWRPPPSRSMRATQASQDDEILARRLEEIHLFDPED